MSMSTSLRYEIENPSAKALKKALLRQHQRIKDDEAMTEKEGAVKSENRTNLLADWVERLEETSAKKKSRRVVEETKEEFLHANQELTTVRRDQLRTLLTKEQKGYAEELKNVGKTFHIQRS